MALRLPLGKRFIEQAGRWTVSAALYGTAAFLAVLYVTDWKVTNRYIPYYGGKFPPVEEKKEEDKDE